MEFLEYFYAKSNCLIASPTIFCIIQFSLIILRFLDNFILGIPLSHLDSKLVEVRGYQINWQTFHQTGVLSKEEWDFIGVVDAKSRKERTELISKYIEKVLNL